MSKIEINIIIDESGVTSEMQQVFAALAVLGKAANLANDLGTPKKEGKSPAKEEKKEVSIPVDLSRGVSEIPEPTQEEPVKESEHTIEEVRELAVGKGTKHREAVKAKITELGAANLVKLDPKHYGVFVEFLGTLKD